MTGNGVAAALYWRIDRERIRLGWSGVELSKRSGIARTTIMRMRDQAQLPLPATVIALADAVGVEREEAFKLAGFDAYPAVPSPQHLGDASLEATVADALRARLPDVDPELLARVVLNLADILTNTAADLREQAEEERS